MVKLFLNSVVATASPLNQVNDANATSMMNALMASVGKEARNPPNNNVPSRLLSQSRINNV
jgi:hypothetical protein